jgi:hypothetical protein
MHELHPSALPKDLSFLLAQMPHLHHIIAEVNPAMSLEGAKKTNFQLQEAILETHQEVWLSQHPLFLAAPSMLPKSMGMLPREHLRDAHSPSPTKPVHLL